MQFIMKLKKIVIYILLIAGFVFLNFHTVFGIGDSSQVETSVSVITVCGDGVTDPGEACDPGDSARGILPDLGTTTCATYGYLDGHVSCTIDCSAIISDMCNTCGNGIREGEEQCDVSDYNSQTCQSFGYTYGNLACTPESPGFPGQSPPGCLINLAGCYNVGLIQPGTESSGTGGGGGGGARGGGGQGVPNGVVPGSNVPPDQTKVIITGKSYPNVDVHVLVDGKVIGIVRADSKADFYFESSSITPGLVSFGLWSEDQAGIKSTLLTLTLRVITGAITTISGAYISPTIDIEKKSVKKGELVKMFGQTVPASDVHIYVHSGEEIVSKTNSLEDGKWILNFDTKDLEEDFHTAKALFQTTISGNNVQSGFSRSISFYVGNKEGANQLTGDLNGDGRVNLTDFSILLFNWGNINQKADLNSNGKVDLPDFSIMMFYWTG
jgi:hypothetical protein